MTTNDGFPTMQVNGADEGGHNKELNDWLPVTASRNAKWWYSAIHNVTAMVGAGVLGLPYAMSQLTWPGGVIVILASWSITFYTLWQLVEMHEVVPGKRFDRYPELGMHAFGPRLGYWVVMPQQTIVQVAINIVYMVTGGKSLRKFFELISRRMGDTRETYYILVFAVVQVFLSQTPNFNELKSVSMAAALMSIFYSLIACIASIIKGVHHHNVPVDYGLRGHTTADKIFGCFNGLGTIAFAFAGHSVVLEIQATIPSTPDKPSNKPMWRGVTVAYLVVAFCYISVAFSGFWAFGNQVADDVLLSMEKPSWLICVANFMVFIHVVGSYQVFAMPMFDMIESYLVMKRKLRPGRPLRTMARGAYVGRPTILSLEMSLYRYEIARSVYFVLTLAFLALTSAATALVGVCIPFFGGLLGFFGGLAFASTSFFLPCIMWLILHRPKRWSMHWIVCWVCIIFGLSLTILAPIGGAREIIISAKTYKMFS